MPYDDLDVWKRSARLSVALYRETKELRDFGFRDQLTRSGLSVPSNIAEGYERDSDKEIARFLTIAKGSAGEMRTQILIGIEAGYIEKEVGQTWANEAQQLGRMLGALIQRHRKKEKNASSEKEMRHERRDAREMRSERRDAREMRSERRDASSEKEMRHERPDASNEKK